MKNLHIGCIFFAFLMLGIDASAQKYKGPAAFGLYGPVKDCVVIDENKESLSNSDPYGFNVVRFMRDGRVESLNDDKTIDGFTYSADGYLTGYTMHIQPFLFFTDGEERRYMLVYKNGRLFQRQSYDMDYPRKRYVCAYYYNESGILTKELYGNMMADKAEESKDGLDPGNFLAEGFFDSDDTYLDHVSTFKVLETDRFGNYTAIKIAHYNLNTDKWEFLYELKRKITYYDSASEKPSAGESQNAADMVVEPSRDLTIEDLISKPLGVMTGVQSIWDPKKSELAEFASRRANWKLTTGFMGICLYGNRQYYSDKVSPQGYNMTYRGEPFFSVSFDSEGRDDVISNYSYDFFRYIKGKIPKHSIYTRQQIEACPQWTKEEVVAFADGIVNDLRKVGINMRKKKNLKNDIYTMEGIDRKSKSYYEVRIYKGDFYGVSLDIYGENNYKYRNFKD